MRQLIVEQLLINEYIYLSRGNFLNFKGHMKVTRNSWLFNSYKFMLNLLVKWELVELHGTHEDNMGQLVMEQLLINEYIYLSRGNLLNFMGHTKVT